MAGGYTFIYFSDHTTAYPHNQNVRSQSQSQYTRGGMTPSNNAAHM